MTPTERLPDMDPDEREFVQELSPTLDALAARMASCPPFDQVLASHEGVLPEPVQHAVTAHVHECTACQALLHDALASDIEVTATHLARGRARVVAGEPSRRVRTASWPSLVAIAASLVAAVAAGLWAFSLRQENRALRDTAAASESDVAQQLAAARARTQALAGEVARLQQPAVALNVALMDLEPIGALRSGALPTVSLSRTAPLVTLVLAVTGTPARESYALEIRDSADRVVWTGQGLVATSTGTVTLAVPRALLPTGAVTLRLTAAGGAPVHRYAVRVEEAP
jgi:hypothetical protein